MTQSAFVACDEKVVGTNRPRVLLGDDHVPFNDKLRSLLTPHFDVVGAAHDGEEVIAAAQRLRPDVIVLDISMPGPSGIEVAKRLRREGCNAIIVFLSADDHLSDAAIEAGGSAYVSKSLADSHLLQAITEAVAGWRYIAVRPDKGS